MSRPLFDDFTVRDMTEHAAAHPDTEPLLIDFSHRNAFIANVAGMPVGQITWTMVQDESCYSEDDDIAGASKGDFNGYHLKITALAVDERFRLRGIAKLLFARFTEYADKSHGFLNGPGSGWDPGTFTADGAAFYKAITGETVEVTQRVSIG